MTEHSYQDLNHPNTCVAVKKLVEKNKSFKITKIPVGGILSTMNIFMQGNNVIQQAYKMFVDMLNERSSYLNAQLILDGRTPNSRTIWINIVRNPISYEKQDINCGKMYDIIHCIAKLIGEAVNLPTATVEKRISLSAIQENRKIYYVQASEDLVLIATAKTGFSFQSEWNKSWYEQIYNSAVSSVANKHDMKTAKYERIAHIQAEESSSSNKISPFQRQGSARDFFASKNILNIPKIRGSSTSAINDDSISNSDLRTFSVKNKNILDSEGLGGTYYNKMGRSNQALYAVTALLGFSVESDIENHSAPLEAKLCIDSNELFTLELSKSMQKSRKQTSF